MLSIWYVSVSMNQNAMKQKFDERMIDLKSNSLSLLSRKEYNEKIDRILQLSAGTKKEQTDYRIIGRLLKELLEDGTLLTRLQYKL